MPEEDAVRSILAIVGQDDFVEILDPTAGELVERIQVAGFNQALAQIRDKGGLLSFTLGTPTGTWLAARGGLFGGAQADQEPLFKGAVSAAAFSHDGRLAALATEDHLAIFDLECRS